MPDYELHADYDRDGRLNGTSQEYALRLQGPGAVIVANLDVDRRMLPRSVSRGVPPTLDFAQPTGLAGDDELLVLEIRTTNASAPAGSQFILRCSNDLHTRIRLSQSTGEILRQTLGTPREFIVPPFSAATPLRLILLAKAIPGSLATHTSNLDLVFRPDTGEESRFELELLTRASDGTETIYDRGRFTIAPFILVDRNAPCYRIYICNLLENQASITELLAVARAIGVQVIHVPASLSNGDSWLQDQYQHTVMQGPGGWRQLIVHLPRMRQNMIAASTGPNLAGFVDAHFASRDIGSFTDLWKRVLLVPTTGSPLQINFRDTYSLAMQMNLVFIALNHINEYGLASDQNWRRIEAGDWISARLALPGAINRLRQRIGSASTGAAGRTAALLEARLHAANTLYGQVTHAFPLSRGAANSSDYGRRQLCTVGPPDY